MKLKNSLTRNTLISPKNVEKRAIAHIEKGFYNILDKDARRIVFDNYTGMFSFRGENLAKVDGG